MVILNFFVLLAVGSCHAHLFSESTHVEVISAGLYDFPHLCLVGRDYASGVEICQESDSEVELQFCQRQEYNYQPLEGVYDLYEAAIGWFDRYRLEVETVQICQTVGRSHLLKGDLARHICIRNGFSESSKRDKYEEHWGQGSDRVGLS